MVILWKRLIWFGLLLPLSVGSTVEKADDVVEFCSFVVSWVVELIQKSVLTSGRWLLKRPFRQVASFRIWRLYRSWRCFVGVRYQEDAIYSNNWVLVRLIEHLCFNLFVLLLSLFLFLLTKVTVKIQNWKTSKHFWVFILKLEWRHFMWIHSTSLFSQISTISIPIEFTIYFIPSELLVWKNVVFYLMAVCHINSIHSACF